MPPSNAQGFIRVEPKVFFANERTFLSWLHFVIILGGLALGLLNFSNNQTGKISGILFTVISMGIMLYALWLYLHRAQKIRKKEPEGYESRFAPIVIVLVLFSAVLINFALKVSSLDDSGNDGASPSPSP
ncbi:hypothetical protein BKA69DRAFT_586163 [Paraphysoderma sedebokerense]|nr:hypothetical protein BKA69DRAFT_586163 [Paraphysoderma sedebokerense]